jgi:nuclear transport factor 2 (NTF2) superfamily protein
MKPCAKSWPQSARAVSQLLWSDKDREEWFSLRENHEKGFRFGLHQLRNCLGLKEHTTMNSRPPLPPFTPETAVEKVRLAEDGWNTRDPEKVALAYTVDSRWRNRAEFPTGREQIVAFLKRKWTRELDYRLIKELWAFTGNRIAVRFAYEYHDDSGNWFRAYGNENWEFDSQGLMYARHASINELPIPEGERKFHWPLGRRPDDHLGLSALSL